MKNYTGDRLNFGLAAEMARAEGLAVAMVVVADDVALAATAENAGRRGLAGTILVHKVAGAAAEAGATLAEVAAEARGAAEAVGTMGVALSPCTVPAAGRPGFALGDDEVELGLGIHGEPGVRRGPLEPADALVDQIVGAIVDDARLGRGERVALLVNNLGGTPTMELAIVARRALAALEGRGLAVERAFAGTFLSALEMAGVSLSVLRLDDRRLARLDATTDAPAWPNAPARPRAPRIPRPAPEAPAAGRPLPGPPTTPVGRALGAAIRAAAGALIAAGPRLTEMDRLVGDGDLGLSLGRGARAALDALPSYPLDDPAAALHALGLTLQGALGGTSGRSTASSCSAPPPSCGPGRPTTPAPGPPPSAPAARRSPRSAGRSRATAPCWTPSSRPQTLFLRPWTQTIRSPNRSPTPHPPPDAARTRRPRCRRGGGGRATWAGAPSAIPTPAPRPSRPGSRRSPRRRPARPRAPDSGQKSEI